MRLNRKSERVQTGALERAAHLLARWARDERGTTAIEYGLIATGIFLGVVGSALMFGENMSTMLNYVSSTVLGVLF